MIKKYGMANLLNPRIELPEGTDYNFSGTSLNHAWLTDFTLHGGVVEFTPSAELDPSLPRLTQDEQALLALGITGVSHPKMGKALYSSKAFVASHLPALFEKLDVPEEPDHNGMLRACARAFDTQRLRVKTRTKPYVPIHETVGPMLHRLGLGELKPDVMQALGISETTWETAMQPLISIDLRPLAARYTFGRVIGILPLETT